jgi:hypothetical protein
MPGTASRKKPPLSPFVHSPAGSRQFPSEGPAKLQVAYPTSDIPILVSLADLSQVLGVSRQTARRALAAGDVPSIRLNGGPNSIVYYRFTDILRWASARSLDAADLQRRFSPAPNLGRGDRVCSTASPRSLNSKPKRR